MTTTAAASPDEMRTRMIDTLVSQIHPSEETVRALRVVPRHVFLPGIELDRIYGGGAIPTRHDEKGSPISSSSEVAIMAMMLDALRLERGQRVLEIGAGTGYNAAALAEIAGESDVVTVDIDPEIVAEAQDHLRVAGYPAVRVEVADGWLGWSDAAPYARIELTAATADVSPHWVDQLDEGGILVAPLLLRPNAQALVSFRKRGTTLDSRSVFAGGFMSLRGVGAAGDLARALGPWQVSSSRALDDDRLLALLREKPSVEVAEPASWSDLAMLAIADENSLALSRKGSPAYSNGIVADDGGSVAFAEWMGGVLSPRLLLVSYGGPEALERLRRRIDEVRGRAWQGLRVTAVPTGGARPDGDVVFVRENYTFAVSASR